MLRKISNGLPILLLAPLMACNSGASDKHPDAVYVDSAFTKMYMPDQGGVIAADGTMSILLDDGSSLFMTGDCFIGKAVDGKMDTNMELLNNSLVHISADGKYLGSIFNGTLEKPETLCVPLEAKDYKEHVWYWPGHGFQVGNTLHTFWSKFYQAEEGQWGFRYLGLDYIRFDMNDYSILAQEELYGKDCPVHWGTSVMKVGDLYYVYGTRSDIYSADLRVSRAKYDAAAGKLGAFEYFDGQGWNTDPAASGACEGLDIPVSEQLSVFKHGDKYVLLSQRRAQQAGDIYTFVADSPTGPWYNKQLHYTTTEQVENPTLFTYNAMAHPQYINENDELLICYNINSYVPSDLYTNVQFYRPVFLRVPMSRILPGEEKARKGNS